MQGFIYKNKTNKKTIFSNEKENIQLKQSNNANQGINLISKTAF